MHQIGTVLFVLWGIVHLFAAYQVFKLGTIQDSGNVQGRIYQNAWNLMYFAVFVIAVAVVYNWNNSLLGYWLNLVTTSITDIGFILFILVPGHLKLKKGITGPFLWILALIFSTLGIYQTLPQ